MATLTLTRLWVNLVATGAAITAGSLPGRAVANVQAGEVRTFAGGRQRAITRAGVQGTYDVTLRLVPRADVDTLKSWIGQPVQVRDNLGRLLVGVYFGVPEIERKGQTLFDVALSVKAVDV